MGVDSTNSFNEYLGDDTTPTYAYTFQILADADLLVTELNLSGVETILVLGNDYTVTNAGVDTGGNVTRNTGNLPTGFKWFIRRNRILLQGTDVKNQSTFFPATYEKALDSLLMQIQALQYQIGQGIRIPEAETAQQYRFPSVDNRKSKALLFDSNGDPIAGVLATTAVPISTFMEGVVDQASPIAAKNVLHAQFIGKSNLSITASVAANALTIALKQKDGTDPTVADPVTVAFRDTVLTNGAYSVFQITVAESIVIPDTATLDSEDGVDHRYYVYAINNLSTIELAVSRSILDEEALHTTVALGVGSDDKNTLYSTAARTSVPIRLIASFNATEATAGTWATAPSTQSRISPIHPHRPMERVFLDSSVITAYTVKDSDRVIEGDAAAAAIAVTVPSAVGRFGQWHWLTKSNAVGSGGFAMTFTPAAGLIGGFASLILFGQNECAGIYSDGTNWIVHTRHATGAFEATPVTHNWTTGVASANVRWQRRAKFGFFEFIINMNDVNVTDGGLVFTLPFGLNIDGSFFASLINNKDVGQGSVFDTDAANSFHGKMGWFSATQLQVFVLRADGTFLDPIAVSGSGSVPIVFASSDVIKYECEVPIVGWDA